MAKVFDELGTKLRVGNTSSWVNFGRETQNVSVCVCGRERAKVLEERE